METMNNTPKTNCNCDPIRNRNLFVGITLVAAGGLWLLKNFRVLSENAFDVIFSWPSLLVVLGAYLLCQYKWIAGGIIGAIGLCLLISDIAGVCIPFNKIILPLVCIGAGAAVLLTKKQ